MVESTLELESEETPPLNFNGIPLIFNKVFRPVKLIYYGSNGLGKTTLAIESPNPLLMDMEGNSSHLDVYRLPEKISSEYMALDFLRWVLRGEHKFKTLVIDSIDQLENIISASISKANEDMSYGNGKKVWNKYISKFEELFEEIYTTRKMNLVFIAHEKVATSNDPMISGHECYDFRVNSYMKTAFANWVQGIFLLKEHKVLSNEKGSFNKKKVEQGRTIVLYTRGDPTYFGKNVFDLPEKIIYEKGKGWAEISKHIKEFYNTK